MEITIPTSWQDITIGQYIKLRPVLKAELNPIERVINILAVLTNQKKEVIKNIPLSQYKVIKEKMNFLETEIPKQLEKRRFKIGDTFYEFKVDAKKLLFGEYINNMEILQKAANNEEVIYENLHHVLTTICRPVEKKWLRWREIDVDGEVLRKTADNFFNNMPITIAYPIGVFFYNHFQSLTQDIRISLMEKATKMMKEASQEMDLVKDGDGGA
tara:strand:- start:569 stop:1210 length:642 start_codon:yes stop_codon:yes gene_type:complete